MPNVFVGVPLMLVNPCIWLHNLKVVLLLT